MEAISITFLYRNLLSRKFGKRVDVMVQCSTVVLIIQRGISSDTKQEIGHPVGQHPLSNVSTRIFKISEKGVQFQPKTRI